MEDSNTQNYVQGLMLFIPDCLINFIRPNPNGNKNTNSKDKSNTHPNNPISMIFETRKGKSVNYNKTICEQKQEKAYVYTEYWEIIEDKKRHDDI